MKLQQCIISKYGISCLNYIKIKDYFIYKNIILKEKIIFYLIFRTAEFVIKDFIYNNNIFNNTIKNNTDEIYNFINFS